MVGVERFYKALNHACKIFGEERDTSECFDECEML